MRDVLLYFLIAIVLVGTELIVLVRYPDVHVSSRIAASVFTGVIIAVYLIKSFKTKLRRVQFWLLLVALLTVHFLWTPFAPMLITTMGMGVEFLLFAVVTDRLLTKTTHRTEILTRSRIATLGLWTLPAGASSKAP